MEEVELEVEDLKDALYQLGFKPFTVPHGTRLVEVLRSWKAMVERGDWKVGNEGIEDGKEAFKEADTADEWWKFLMPRSW